MLFPIVMSNRMKISMAHMEYLPMSWSVNPEVAKATQAIVIALGLPTQLDGMTLLLQTPHTRT